MRRGATAFAVAMAVGAAPSRAQEALTLEGALALARAQAPRVAAAQARVAEARARMRGVTPLFRENPVLEWSQGPRSSPAGDSRDQDWSLSQPIGWPGARSARIGSARAEVEREIAVSQDVLRQALREVGASYLDGARAQSRLEQALAEQALAEELARIARRRHAAGDVAALDVNLSEGALARARAEVEEARAVRVGALASLRGLLGLPAEPPLVLSGLDAAEPPPAVDVAAAVQQRPDVLALVHAVAQAEEDRRLGGALAWPQLGLTFRHEREQQDTIWMGGLTVTLPIFDRGQALRAEGEARAARLRAELEALRRSAAGEIQAASEAYVHRRRALEQLAGAVPLLEDNERLARRSYEEGEIGLAELLLVRRETIETRRALLERQHAAALARVGLLFTTGAWR